MTFVLPSDPDYLRAKRIRLGAARLDPAFDGFVAAFAQRFGVVPLSLGLDAVELADRSGRRARLGVVLERTAQQRRFLKSAYTFDPAKQAAVARLFLDALAGQDLRRLFGFPRMSRTTSEAVAAGLFVCFEDFESVAVQDAHGSVTAEEIDAFAAALGLPAGQLWCVQKAGGPPIVFVHTRSQADAVRAGELPARWADAYFAVVRRHDPFGYLAREHIAVAVDSRESFERDFGGSWYSYFK